jgi:hypothetical protein
MNLLRIAVITIFVFLEQGFPVGNWSARIGWFAGIGLIVSGVEVLVVGRRPYLSNEKIPPPGERRGNNNMNHRFDQCLMFFRHGFPMAFGVFLTIIF